MQIANFFVEYFQNLKQSNFDKLYIDYVLKIKLGYQAPGSRPRGHKT